MLVIYNPQPSERVLQLCSCIQYIEGTIKCSYRNQKNGPHRCSSSCLAQQSSSNNDNNVGIYSWTVREGNDRMPFCMEPCMFSPCICTGSLQVLRFLCLIGIVDSVNAVWMRMIFFCHSQLPRFNFLTNLTRGLCLKLHTTIIKYVSGVALF